MPSEEGSDTMAIDLYQFMEEASRIPGVPGYEAEIGRYYAEAARPYADEITTDALGSVTVRVGNAGPKVMIAAHHDEIGLMITDIEDDGCLRFTRNGGVDPRILPGMELSVITREGALYGVVGAKPPHLLTAKERSKALKMEQLYIDLGYDAETVRKKVRVGDMAVMLARPVKLMGTKLACKTMDDRASVASMLVAMEMTRQLNSPARAYYVATSQEEIGSKGAKTAAYSIAPDFAVAVDVTHGEGPGTGKWEAFPLEKMTIVSGPHLHPELTKICQETADKWRIPYTREIASGHTGTDASAIFNAHGGVPTILLSVPLRYMHTTVEVGDVDVIRDVGRLMALFIDEVARRWEEIKWY